MNKYPVTMKIEWAMGDILFLEENTDWPEKRDSILKEMATNDLTDAIPYVKYRDMDLHHTERYFATVDSAEHVSSLLKQEANKYGLTPPTITIYNNA